MSIKKSALFNKRKGSFTPAVAILLVFFILVATLSIDYSRFNSVEPIVHRQASNALDVALMNYDIKLKDAYDLYGVSDSDAASQQISYCLNKSLTAADFKTPYHVTLESLDVSSVGAGLADKDTLKQMIIENHSKAFIANQMAEWLERIDALKDLEKVINLVEQFNTIVKQVSKLEKLYYDLKALYDQFDTWQNTAKKFDGAAIASHLINLYDDLDDIEDDIDVLKEEREDDPLGDNLNSELYDEKLEKLNDKFDRVEDDIEELEDEVSDFIDSVDIVFDLIDETKQFSDQLSDVCNEVEAVIESLPTDSIETFNNNLGDIVKNVAEYAQEILDGLSDANAAFNSQVEIIDNLADEVKQYTDLLKDLLDDEPSSADQYKNILSLDGQISFTIIDLLKHEISGQDSLSFKRVFNALYQLTRRVATGQLGYDFGEIPEDVYQKLPSRQQNLQSQLLGFNNHSVSGSNAQIDALNQQMEQSTDFVKMLTGAMANGMQSIVEKMIIADYIMQNFSYNYQADAPAHNRYFSGAEVEYILNGNRVAGTNAIFTEATIFGTRTVLNAISILAFKETELNSITAELAAMTGGLSYPVIYGLCVIGWSAIESGIDLAHLKDHKRVLFFKLGNDINFDLSLDALFNPPSQEAFDNVVDDLNPLALDYSNYLFLLLLAQPEDVTLYRIMDMITVSDVLEDKELASYKTEIALKMSYRLNSWFNASKLAPAQTVGQQLTLFYKVYNLKLQRGY